MPGLPDAMIIIDVGYEDIAVSEAVKLGIPVVGVVDSNNSPKGIDYVIPGNDDAIRSIRLYVKIFADAVIEGRSSVAHLAGEGRADEFVELDEAGAPIVEEKPKKKKVKVKKKPAQKKVKSAAVEADAADADVKDLPENEPVPETAAVEPEQESAAGEGAAEVEATAAAAEGDVSGEPEAGPAAAESGQDKPAGEKAAKKKVAKKKAKTKKKTAKKSAAKSQSDD